MLFPPPVFPGREHKAWNNSAAELTSSHLKCRHGGRTVGQKGHGKTYQSIGFKYMEREEEEESGGGLNEVATWAGVMLCLEVTGCQRK